VEVEVDLVVAMEVDLEVATVGEAMAAEAVFSRSSDTQFYC